MGLVLNFSPLRFGDAEIDVDVLEYRDDGAEALKRLRQKHWATHVFRRDGADEIVGVPVATDLPKLSTRSKTLRLEKNLRDIFDRMFGSPTQAVEVTGAEGQSMEVRWLT